MRTHLHDFAFVLLGVACSEPREQDPLAPPPSDDGADETTAATSTTTGVAPALDLGASPGVDTTGSGECAGVSVDAIAEIRPADVVMIIDSSASMGFENAEVQARLNAFAASLAGDDVDVRLVLLAAASEGWYGPEWAGFGMCVDEPLGSGACNDAPDPGAPAVDSVAPRFLHLDTYVRSSSALAVALASRDDWEPVLRPGGVAHVVIVSDDDATVTSAEAFTAAFLQEDAEPPVIVHGVVALQPCDAAASIGAQYIALAEASGGVVTDLCEGDFDAVFEALTAEVVASAELPCTWQLPAPPVGEALDLDEVNVRFDDGASGGFVIGRVEAPEACALVDHGWYYDDPSAPQAIVACPATCTAIQGEPAAHVEIELGCATVPAG